jgi:hypothetical protein
MADINLTTTAVTATGVTIATLRDRLRRELHDEDSDTYRWQDEVLDRHLERAVRELSLVLPREQKTALSTTDGSRELGVSTLSDLVRIDAVEYPTGCWPPCYVQFSLYGGVLTLLSESLPGAAEAVNVYWGRLHTLSDMLSTLPAAVEDVVVLGAGAYAATEWANFAANRANVAGTEAFVNYRSWGADAMRRFREQLRTLGENARVRAASLFTAEQPGSSRNVVQWDL